MRRRRAHVSQTDRCSVLAWLPLRYFWRQWSRLPSVTAFSSSCVNEPEIGDSSLRNYLILEDWGGGGAVRTTLYLPFRWQWTKDAEVQLTGIVMSGLHGRFKRSLSYKISSQSDNDFHLHLSFHFVVSSDWFLVQFGRLFHLVLERWKVGTAFPLLKWPVMNEFGWNLFWIQTSFVCRVDELFDFK